MKKILFAALLSVAVTPAWSFSEKDLAKFKALNKCVKCDLSAADLVGANLNKADLREADLSAANLAGANLNKANLREANLNKAT